MEPKLASDPPGLRSIEITTQDARSDCAADGELFLDLRIEVRSTPTNLDCEQRIADESKFFLF